MLCSPFISGLHNKSIIAPLCNQRFIANDIVTDQFLYIKEDKHDGIDV